MSGTSIIAQIFTSLREAVLISYVMLKDEKRHFVIRNEIHGTHFKLN